MEVTTLETSSNPFFYLSERYLKRQIKKITRRLIKASARQIPKIDFEANRAILLSLTEALQARTQIAEMNKLYQTVELPEPLNK